MEPQQTLKYHFPTTLSFITIIFTVVASEIPGCKLKYCTFKIGNTGATLRRIQYISLPFPPTHS